VQPDLIVLIGDFVTTPMLALHDFRESARVAKRCAKLLSELRPGGTFADTSSICLLGHPHSIHRTWTSAPPNSVYFKVALYQIPPPELKIPVETGRGVARLKEDNTPIIGWRRVIVGCR
jgi:hypothetical protein